MTAERMDSRDPVMGAWAAKSILILLEIVDSS